MLFKLRAAIHYCVDHETNLVKGNWNFFKKSNRKKKELIECNKVSITQCTFFPSYVCLGAGLSHKKNFTKETIQEALIDSTQ